MNKFLIISLLLIFTSASFSQDTKPETVTLSQMNSQNKSIGKHILLSLILPGAGEWAYGRKGLGKVFMGTEISLWVSYFATKNYVNVLQNDLEAYAVQHAGVQNASNKSDQYWVDISTSPNIFDYNAQRLLERDLSSTYSESQDFYWQWDSQDNQVKYGQKRIDRVDWKQRTNWVIGTIVLNRLVSMIDVVRLFRTDKSKMAEKKQSFLHFDLQHKPFSGEQIKLNLMMRL